MIAIALPLRRLRWPRVGLWRRLARERRALAALDSRLLRDIGLTPDQVAVETRRPPWDAPAKR